jgi:FkbH-like protein
VDQTPFRFAISATFTAEPLQPVLRFWGRRLEANFEIRFAPYNQVLQSLLDPAGEFASNHHGVNVVLARVEDLGAFENGDMLGRLQSNLAHLAGVVRDAPTHLSAPIIFVLCPPSPEFLGDPARAAFAHDAALRLDASFDDLPGVQFVTAEQVARLYPVEAVHSPEGDRLGHIPYTEAYFCALATSIVRLARALFAPPYKVIALDCDNTLWQGICGEDGPRGVVVDPPRCALQEFMAEQREQGMLLVLASKNNEPDVLETFESQPSMPLQLRHFTGWRLNWESKAENLASLADELSLGLDSFIFVDDNPKECAEVEQSLPEVLSLALPENPADFPRFLDHIWAFDHPVITEEDRNRNAYYAQAQEFGRELRRTVNYADFMRSLDLKVRIEPLTSDRLPRVAQLTQRTNQFNFTTIRRTESEIQKLINEGGHECMTVDVSDRFGDYGLVGVLIFSTAAGALILDTALLSCRALGRGVEHRMLAHLAAEAGRRSLEFVDVRLDITRKNLPARQFLHEIGSALEIQRGDSLNYRFPAPQLAAIEWKPAPRPEPAPRPAPKRAQPSSRRFVAFADIARNLSTTQQILDALRRDSAPELATAAGMSETEEKLAAIWAELLQKPKVAPNDNFFDLGGHSLLAVMLIMRVREAFGVELPINDVYSATLTLNELARKIEMHQMGITDSADYDALLAEIENLSDEEVARLLAEEDPGALQS